MSILQVATNLPFRIREIEHVRIPMADGVQLVARIWLPEGAEDAPVPAILEYIPYRRRDMTRPRDAVMHAYFAGHGYAAVRVDMRGSGFACHCQPPIFRSPGRLPSQSG